LFVAISSVEFTGSSTDKQISFSLRPLRLRAECKQFSAKIITRRYSNHRRGSPERVEGLTISQHYYNFLPSQKGKMAGSHDLWLRTKVPDTNGMSPHSGVSRVEQALPWGSTKDKDDV
jgi:hypothetical protein